MKMHFDFVPNLKELDLNIFENNDFQQEFNTNSNLLHEEEELINIEENINERESFIFSSQDNEAYYENQNKSRTFINKGKNNYYSIEGNGIDVNLIKSNDNIEYNIKNIEKKCSDNLKLFDCYELSDMNLKNLKNLSPIKSTKNITQNGEINETKIIKNIIKEEKSNIIIEIQTDNKIKEKSNDVNLRTTIVNNMTLIKKPIFKVFYLFNNRRENEINLKYTTKDIKRTINSLKETKIKKFFCVYKEKNKDNKVNRSRKFKPDNIRKKIKSRFFKYLIKLLNEKLILANSEKKFKTLQQCFITPITKKNRDTKKILNMTLKELITTDFNRMFGKKSDSNTYNKNMETIKYLEENRLIKEKINFDFICQMTYQDLFNEFLESKEFVEDINRLKRKNERTDYIKDYIIKAHNFIDYFYK